MNVFTKLKSIKFDIKRDLSEGFNRLIERPLVLIAPIIILFIHLAFYFKCYLYISLILVALSFICIYKFQKTYIRFLILICLFICLYSGFVISQSLNSDIYIDEEKFYLTVNKIEMKLDENHRIYVSDSKGNRFLLDKCVNMPEISVGDGIYVFGRLSEPLKAGNPGEFDYQSYLKKKGINYVLKPYSIEVIKQGNILSKLANRLNLIFFEIKKNSLEILTTDLNDEFKEVIASICFGDSSLLDKKLKQNFQRIGLSHLLAVSGTHFSGFLILLPGILDKLNIKRKYSVLIYSIFTIAIGSITGWTESVTRAALMSVFSFLGRDYLSGMSLAIIFLVLGNPFSILQNGFHMSFSTCLSIKFFNTRIDEFLSDKGFNKKLSGILSVSLAAIIGMLPFMNSISQRISILNLFTQIVGSFLAQLCCVFIIPSIILSLIFGNGFEYPLLIPIKLLNTLTNYVSQYSVYSVNMGRIDEFVILWVWILIVFLLLPMSSIKRILKIPILVLSIAVLSVFTFNFFNKPLCTVDFIDVSQGDCALIRAGGKVVLIDSGTYIEGENVINYLNWLNIDHVDYAIMSHWDFDHAAGFMSLLNEGIIDKIYSQYNGLDNQTIEFLQEYISTDEMESFMQNKIIVLKKGNKINLSENIYLEVLSPEDCQDGQNDSSLLIELNCLNTKILFTGDISSTKEEELIRSGILNDVDILKVAHHGSKYSTSQAFIDCLKPEYSIISCGLNNIYGHPSKETVDRLLNYGSNILQTSTDGLISVEIYNNQYKVTSFR